MATVAVIPAYGGSQGIPGRNIRALNSTPLIVHTIATAYQARLITSIVVPIDDAGIGDVAAEAGAEIIRRPAEISGDSTSSEAMH